MIYSTSLPVEYRNILATPSLVLSSAMACRVFRAVMLGDIKDPDIGTTSYKLSFFRGAQTTQEHNMEDPQKSRVPHGSSGTDLELDITDASTHVRDTSLLEDAPSVAGNTGNARIWV